MSWLKRILIGLGIVLALLIAIVVVVGYWGGPSGPVTQTMSMTVGSRTVTVGGHYKNMTQESLAEGVKVTVDGHEIEVTADQLEVDGKTQVLEPGQNVEIWVNEKGEVDVKVVHADAGSAGKAPE